MEEKKFQVEFIAAWEDLEKDSRQIFLGWEHVWGHHALPEVFCWWCRAVIGDGSLLAIPGAAWLIPLPGKRFLLFLHYLSICEMWLHGKAVTFRHPWIWGCLLGSVLQQLPGSSWGKCGRGGPRHRGTWICWVGMLAEEPGVIAETRTVRHITPKRFFAGQEDLKYLPSLGSGSYAKRLAVWFS